MFKLISGHSFSFDVTLLEKSKAQPHLKVTEHSFYEFAWYYHFRMLAQREVQSGDSLFVVASEIGTKKSRATFRAAVNNVLARCLSYKVPRVLAFWPNTSDPCLQVADYCTWAISRKYERNDVRSYALIEDKIRTEYDLFSTGNTHYY